MIDRALLSLQALSRIYIWKCCGHVGSKRCISTTLYRYAKHANYQGVLRTFWHNRRRICDGHGRVPSLSHISASLFLLPSPKIFLCHYVALPFSPYILVGRSLSKPDSAATLSDTVFRELGPRASCAAFEHVETAVLATVSVTIEASTAEHGTVSDMFQLLKDLYNSADS